MYDTAPTSPSVEMVQNQIGEPRAEMVQNQLGEPWKTGLFDCQQNPANELDMCSPLFRKFDLPFPDAATMLSIGHGSKPFAKSSESSKAEDWIQIQDGMDSLATKQYNRDIQVKSSIPLTIKPCPMSGNEIDETGPESAKAETTNNHTEEPRAEIVQNQIGEPWITGLFDCHQNRTNAIMTAFLPCMTFGQIAEVLDGGKMRWNGLLAQRAMQQRYPDQIVHPPQNQTMSK
ncbi:hypothetical protein IFM89_024713 [Coptis chinensis]|uniref:Uncharacterized protein n=1 Tax=Coptis chinensis TaxID=261450 RepID=A0A835IFH4_9MAGN|nr:hypothetical protein IFM89_024713 [Coptis chinensis]